MDEEGVARLRLIRTAGIGPVTYRQLLDRFGTGAAALAAVPDLARRGGGAPPRIVDPAAAAREIETVARLGARHVLLGTADYPPRLAALEDAPPLLIARGDVGLLGRARIAMVGARNASAAATRFARQLARELGDEGEIVVSGLARGIDTAAHQGALETGTVAIVAGGIDIVYPPENADLQRTIGERGVVVAEQPPGTEPRARHFPYRNRIIAGLAAATVVVEAAPRSGSLITARLAAEAGREVMAVPGSPLDPRAQGCNQLIRDGATLVQTAGDILESLRPIGGAALREPATPFGSAPPPGETSDAERRAVVALLSPAPVAIDELVRLSGAPAGIVQTVLLELELGGRLDRHAGGRVSLAD